MAVGGNRFEGVDRHVQSIHAGCVPACIQIAAQLADVELLQGALSCHGSPCFAAALRPEQVKNIQ